MNTRVGRLPPQGCGAAFDAALDALLPLVNPSSVDAAALIPHLRALEAERPLHITADQLTRLFTVCYRLIGVEAGPEVAPDASDPHAVNRIGWICNGLIERSLFDERCSSREFTDRSVDHARVLHPGEEASRTTYYRPRTNVPLDRDAAAALLAPYFAWLEQRRDAHATAHLRIVWDIITQPQPPFDGLTWEWLDRIGEGDDFRLALSLYDLRERAQQRLSWSQVEARLFPLLASENPLLVAQSAAFIGSLYTDEDLDRIQGKGAWDGARLLSHIAGLDRHRRVAAGAFLHGIDAMDPNPFAELSRIAPDLDIEDWVMEVLEDRIEEPFIPGCQMFWFYLHEYYDRDVAMVTRFVDAGHNDVALMCITENHPPADGMEPLLERMARGPDEAFAKHARGVLDRLRAPGAS
jgi:hypothetical protein